MALVPCPFGTTWFNDPGDNVPKHEPGRCLCDGEGFMDEEHVEEAINDIAELVSNIDQWDDDE